MLTPKANCIVFAFALGFASFVRGAVSLEANARWHLEFPDLPDTLATMASGERQTPRLTVRLPSNYSRDDKFPLFVFLNGGNGGRADVLPVDRKTIGSNDFICANLPLFKRSFDKTDGGIVSVDDFETVSRAYRVMLQKLFDTVPNITPERSALGGFSNGAHTAALLIAGQDEFVLQHLRAFYFVEGGIPLAANALHRAALKRCRFLWMRGERSALHLTRAVESEVREHGLDFTFVTMRDTGHEFPEKYQRLLGQWIRGEKLSDIDSK